MIVDDHILDHLFSFFLVPGCGLQFKLTNRHHQIKHQFSKMSANPIQFIHSEVAGRTRTHKGKTLHKDLGLISTQFYYLIN